MIWQTPLAVLSGVPIGFQLGAPGAGGTLLAVSLLVYVVGAIVQEAAAISLVIVAASASVRISLAFWLILFNSTTLLGVRL